MRIKSYPVLIQLFAVVIATGTVWSQTIDLRPYYSFMIKEGFTHIFAGQVQDFEDEDLLVDASWFYQTQVSSSSAAGLLTEQRVITNIPTPNGSALLQITGFLTVGEAGVIYHRTEGKTFFAGDIIRVEVTNQGDPLFLPASAELGSTLVVEYDREMRTSFGGFFEMDDITRVRRETTFAAIETITVPAGTFEALRVEERETYEIPLFGTITMQNTDLTRMWFAPDVGLIRIEETEQQSFGIVPGEEFVTSVMELVSFHESFQFDPIESIFFGAASLRFDDLEFFWQPWLGFFLRVDDSAGWIYHPGFGFVHPQGALGLDGRWLFSQDPRLGYFFLDSRFLTYEEREDEDTDEYTHVLRGWLFSAVDGGVWYYFEADILHATLSLWREGQPPATVIQFSPIFSPDDF